MRALSSLDNAQKLDQNDYRIYSNIGNIFYQDGKFEDAIVNYLRSLEIHNEDAETLSNLGICLMKVGNYSGLTFEEALRLEPGNKQIMNNYLFCLLIGKQFAKFTKVLASVKKLLSDQEFDKYKQMHHKFMKVSGIHEIELKNRLAQNIKSKVHESAPKPGLPMKNN